MASLTLGRKRESLTLPILCAVVFHLGLLGAAWWFGRDTGPRIDLNAKPIEAHLVRLGEHRDQKLLPRMAPNTPPPEPKAVPIPDKPSPSAPPKPQKVQKPQPKHDLTKDLFAAFDKTKPVHQGKVTGEADGDAHGDVDQASEGERYFGLISSRIKQNYDVSNTIPDAVRVGLKANIAIFIDPSGRVLRTAWVQKSGNDLFDNAVKAAVQKAGPFPPPPQFLVAQLGRDGVGLTFRP